MGEFARMEEDWGFQAIVSGCTDDLSAAAMSSSFDDLLFDYPNIFEAKSGDYNNNEFDQLYKPFHQVFDDSFSSQSPIGSGTDTPNLSSSFNDKALKLKSQELKMKKGPKTTYKKRKNQHKKMVLQAESLSSDPWAWRKYGQKPIKGSPYPRSYYKCSSSKECVARKQVEESCSDPGMFIITYSGEHNHTQPTRRRSLAGTTRHRFTPHASSSSSSVATVPKDCDSSPTTPLSNSVNIEESTMFQQAVVKNAKNINLVNEEKSCSEVSKDDSECVISDDMLMNDDFFVGLEDLDRLISESGFYSFPYQSL